MKNEIFPLSPGIKFFLDGLSVQTWARKNAEKLLKDSQFSGKKVYLDKLLYLRRIQKKILFDANQKSKGTLTSKKGGFVIRLAIKYKYPSYFEEMRFIIAHEIGHTYFYDIQEDFPKRYSWLGSYSKIEETICDTFASELLMPEKQLINDFSLKEQKDASQNLFIKHLVELSSTYSVTNFVMGLRLIRELELWNGVLLCCSIIGKCIDNIEDEPALRVLWAIVPKNLDNIIFFHHPVSNRGPFMKLRWKSIDEKLEDLISHKIEKLLLSSDEFYKLSNIKKVIPSTSQKGFFEVGLMKIDKYPYAIPFKNIYVYPHGLKQILLISIPLEF